MEMSPVAMVADADVTQRALLCIRLHGRDGKSQRAIGSRNDTTIAVGLLHVVVHLLNHHLRIGVELGVVLYRREISRREKGGGRHFFRDEGLGMRD